MLKAMLMPVLKRAARGYVAGDALDDAMRVAASAAKLGYGVTICYWQADDSPPEPVAEHYLAVIARLKLEGLDAHLALKIPALWERPDLVDSVVAAARAARIPVDIDSHAPEQAEANFEAAARLGSDGLGLAIPGRWLRSLDDADRAIDLGLTVRVVKGSWPDPQAPRMDMREGYLNVIDRLAGRCRHVLVATHDAWLARDSLRRLKEKGTPCTHELLFGLPIEPAAEAGRVSGVPTRIYISYGEAWFPYSVSRALRNPRTLLWLARDMVRGRDGAIPSPVPLRAEPPRAQ
jgi:proline dehydrogenase